MFTGHRLAIALGVVDSQAVNGDDELSRKQLIRAGEAMVNVGLAVVVNHPGTKKPMCTLTAVERKQADQQARDDAAAAGDPLSHRRDHSSLNRCGFKHAITDAATATRVLTRLSRRSRFNLGIEPRASRVVVVDVDTSGQAADFALRCGQERPTLTVRSPGKRDRNGNWVHSNGGHIWFEVPDGIQMPTETGSYTHSSGWKVMWGECQVLVPPSVREEGPYVLVGSTHPLPAWLHELIVSEARAVGQRRTESALRRAQSRPTRLDEWARNTPWAEILLEDGYVETGLVKNCGCPQWTAPGEHASPESVTAHEPGCSTYICDRGHGPLHVWTDNPSEAVRRAIEHYGRRTLTKAEVYTFTHGGEDMRRTFEELGVPLEGPTVLPKQSFLTWEENQDVPESTGSVNDEEDDEGNDGNEDDAEELARRAAEHEAFLTKIEVDRERRRRKAREVLDTENAPPLRVFAVMGLTHAPRPKGIA